MIIMFANWGGGGALRPARPSRFLAVQSERQMYLERSSLNNMSYDHLFRQLPPPPLCAHVFERMTVDVDFCELGSLHAPPTPPPLIPGIF